MRKYKMVFSDVDGTLYNENNEVTPRTREFIGKMVQKGIPFVLVSARMPSAITPVVRQLGLRVPTICHGGALLLDECGKTIHSAAIPQQTAIRMKQEIDALFPDVSCCCYADDEWIADDISDARILEEMDATGVQATQGKVEACLRCGQDVHKLVCVGEPERIEQLRVESERRYPEYGVFTSRDTYLEIMPPHVSKGQAVRQYCAHYGIDVSEVIAFGDYFNDVGMLEAAGMGVAMGNAPEQVKAAADMVTSTNEEEGLLVALKQLLGDQLKQDA